MGKVTSVSIISLTLAFLLLNYAVIPVEPVSGQTAAYVHVGDKVPIVASSLVPGKVYQVNFGNSSLQVFQGIKFTSTGQGTTPAGLTLTIPNTFGGYVFPPTSPSNARAITLSPDGSTTPIVVSIQVIVVPSYTLSVHTGPPGTTVNVTGIAFAESDHYNLWYCNEGNGMFGNLSTTPDDICGGTNHVVGVITADTIQAGGTFSATFPVPSAPQGQYYVIPCDASYELGCNTLGGYLDALGVLRQDLQTFTESLSPSALGLVVSTVFQASVGLGFEETSNIFNNSGAGFTIAHRSAAKVVFVFTDPVRVNQATGELLFSPNYSNALIVAGSSANPTTKFYEDNGFAPLHPQISEGLVVFFNGAMPAYSVPLGSLGSTNDYFVIEAFQDNGHRVIAMWGVNAPGTLASGVYFDANFAGFTPNSTTYWATGYIIHWQGTTPNTPLPSDKYTIVYHT